MAPAGVSIGLLATEHDARRREKRERQHLADALVDAWIETAALRCLVAQMAPYLHTAASRSDSPTPPRLLGRARELGCKTPTKGDGSWEPR